MSPESEATPTPPETSQLVSPPSSPPISPPPPAPSSGLPIPPKEGFKIATLIVSVVALCLSASSAYFASRSAGASMQSANAATLSAQAALTNADWINYQRTPHHDLVARVLTAKLIVGPWSNTGMTGNAYVDLALINNGNQTEIVRRVVCYYVDSTNSNSERITDRPLSLNIFLPKGEKQVLHLPLDRDTIFSGKEVWLKVGVTAIAPDAEDIESKWLVCRFLGATDGTGGSYFEITNKQPIQVISNERLPHQKHVDIPF